MSDTAKNAKAAEPTGKPAVRFTKKQLVASDKYAGRRDMLSVLLEDTKTYTSTEVDEIIKKFEKGAVK